MVSETLGFSNLNRLLFWAGFLHDFGKSADGFQKALRSEGRWQHRHEVLSLLFVDHLVSVHSVEEQDWLCAAIVTHHKDMKQIEQLYSELGDLDLAQLKHIVEQVVPDRKRKLFDWLCEFCGPWVASLGFAELGVDMPSSLTDMASQSTDEQAIAIRSRLNRVRRSLVRAKFDAANPSRDKDVWVGFYLRGVLTIADHAASAHVDPNREPLAMSWVEMCKRILGKRSPYSHQAEAAKKTGRSLVLVAPTGSGKTEAALFWALGESRSATRIYYALPYQASMNAMYDRLRRPEYFGEGFVGLQHGKALHALYHRMIDSETGEHDARKRASMMINLNRLYLNQVKVLSPYQMLKAGFGLRGHEAMFSDFLGSAVILDEVHVYEPKRLALILALCAYLSRNAQVHFFFMSATLPTLLADALRESLGSLETTTAEPSLFREFVRHELRILDGNIFDHGMNLIMSDFGAGKSVLVCCNTVRKAQELYRELMGRAGTDNVTLIHSRLTVRDRASKEIQVVKRCSLHEGSGPFILVATQVVEVSLNIDLDTIYTEPAPLEALVQRFGRVNRARRKGIVPVHVFREPQDGQHVYEERAIKRTMRVLDKQKEKPIDEMAINGWIDEVYSDPEIVEGWWASFRKHKMDFESILSNLYPFDSADIAEVEFEKLFDGVEVVPSKFYSEFDGLIKEGKYIDASELMTSISKGQFASLHRKGLIERREVDGRHYSFVKCAYDEDIGLQLDREDETELRIL
jgi:CRISPR-associated endonuclease/helicase Cas3